MSNIDSNTPSKNQPIYSPTIISPNPQSFTMDQEPIVCITSTTPLRTPPISLSFLLLSDSPPLIQNRKVNLADDLSRIKALLQYRNWQNPIPKVREILDEIEKTLSEQDKNFQASSSLDYTKRREIIIAYLNVIDVIFPAKELEQFIQKFFDKAFSYATYVDQFLFVFAKYLSMSIGITPSKKMFKHMRVYNAHIERLAFAYTTYQRAKIQEIYTLTRQYYPRLHIMIIENFYVHAYETLYKMLERNIFCDLPKFLSCKNRFLEKENMTAHEIYYDFIERFCYFKSLTLLQKCCKENTIPETTIWNLEFSIACKLLAKAVYRFPPHSRSGFLHKSRGYYIKLVNDFLSQNNLLDQYLQIIGKKKALKNTTQKS